MPSSTGIKGSAIFLAQFMGNAAPFNSWTNIIHWVGFLAYKGVQVPAWDGRVNGGDAQEVQEAA